MKRLRCWLGRHDWLDPVDVTDRRLHVCERCGAFKYTDKKWLP